MTETLDHRLRGMIAMALLAMAGLLVGCTQHNVTVDPIEVKPIYIKADVHITVDRQLDSFFDFEEELKPEIDQTREGSR